MSGWVYFAGEVTGADVKIGWTTGSLAKRLQAVNRDQMSEHRYVLLAAVRGGHTAEAIVHAWFADRNVPKGSRREYFVAAEELIEYVLWLRQQWFVVHDVNATEDDAPERHLNEWAPSPTRRSTRPPRDPLRFFQVTDQLVGPLANTYWSFMPDVKASFQDYFTPPELVQRAADAMGGAIDVDAASHWLANRKFRLAGIEIGDYFSVDKDAMTHEWVGRVWLNPPYGENDRWFKRAEVMLDAGLMEQLCMLSPVYAFTTAIARPMVSRSAGAVLLSPTPAFENPADPLKTGTNLPHAIFYWGHRLSEFLSAFEGTGYPFRLELSSRALEAVA